MHDKETKMLRDTAAISYEGRPSIMTVHYGLQYLIGNAKSYFTATADIVSVRGREIAAGTLHGPILEHFPNLMSWITMHLSDFDGVPMYAVENGFYYCLNQEQFAPSVLSAHLRISVEDATSIYWRVKNVRWNKDVFAVYVDLQKPRWKKEAEALVKILEETNV